jgi:hypothetical protein
MGPAGALSDEQWHESAPFDVTGAVPTVWRRESDTIKDLRRAFR